MNWISISIVAYFITGLPVVLGRHVQYMRVARTTAGGRWEPIDWGIAVVMFPSMWVVWLPMELLALIPRKSR